MILSDPTMSSGVRGLIEQVSGSELFTLQSAGLDVASTANWQGLLHHKYLIADKDINSTDPTVITGSHNFTNNAKNVNDENVLIMHSPSMADQFHQDWVARRNEVVGLTELQSRSFRLYPNPAKGLIFLDTEFDSGYIIDPRGRLVQELGTHQTIDVSGLEPGAYQVVLHKDGTRISARFVRSE